MEHQDVTALVVCVQEAMFTQPFRVKYLSQPGATIPPHITLYMPFKLRKDIDDSVLNALTELFGSYAPFSFILTGTARFSDTGVL